MGRNNSAIRYLFIFKLFFFFFFNVKQYLPFVVIAYVVYTVGITSIRQPRPIEYVYLYRYITEYRLSLIMASSTDGYRREKYFYVRISHNYVRRCVNWILKTFVYKNDIDRIERLEMIWQVDSSFVAACGYFKNVEKKRRTFENVNIPIAAINYQYIRY